MRPQTKLWIIVTALAVVGGLLFAASENHRDSLRGLSAVAVRVERLSEEARAGGLSEQALRAEVEQRLKAAGLKVLTAAEVVQTAGRPVLYVRVNARLPYGSDVYAVNVTLALLQDVTAARDPGLTIREAKTWDAGYLRTWPRQSLPQVINTVRDLTEEFVGDWKLANSTR
ncbi:MAG: hypothetical protein ACUVXB_07955 [Bryobacteraceae bacterium]